jgi:hypothetical protein
MKKAISYNIFNIYFISDGPKLKIQDKIIRMVRDVNKGEANNSRSPRPHAEKNPLNVEHIA